MTVKQFTTKISRVTVTIEKQINSSYIAYECRTRGEGGNIEIFHSFSLDWLIDTLYIHYLGEGLEIVF